MSWTRRRSVQCTHGDNTGSNNGNVNILLQRCNFIFKGICITPRSKQNISSSVQSPFTDMSGKVCHRLRDVRQPRDWITHPRENSLNIFVHNCNFLLVMLLILVTCNFTSKTASLNYLSLSCDSKEGLDSRPAGALPLHTYTIHSVPPTKVSFQATISCFSIASSVFALSELPASEFLSGTRSLEGKSSRIVFPRHLTFVSILLEPKALNYTN